MPSEANKRATAKYQKANMHVVKIKINRKTEASILERIEAQPNKQGYIKQLILADMAKHQSKS